MVPQGYPRRLNHKITSTNVEDTSLAKPWRKTFSVCKTAAGSAESGIDEEYRLFALSMASDDGTQEFQGGVTSKYSESSVRVSSESESAVAYSGET